MDSIQRLIWLCINGSGMKDWRLSHTGSTIIRPQYKHYMNPISTIINPLITILTRLNHSCENHHLTFTTMITQVSTSAIVATHLAPAPCDSVKPSPVKAPNASKPIGRVLLWLWPGAWQKHPLSTDDPSATMMIDCIIDEPRK